jgi:hypothetical protein
MHQPCLAKLGRFFTTEKRERREKKDFYHRDGKPQRKKVIF